MSARQSAAHRALAWRAVWCLPCGVRCGVMLRAICSLARYTGTPYVRSLHRWCVIGRRAGVRVLVGGRAWSLVSDACAFPPVCLVIIYESWRNPILPSPARSWTLGGRMVADSHTVLLGSPRHARPNPARAPRRCPIRSLPRAIMARVLGSAEQDGGALMRRALHALRRRRTPRCRCRLRPLRPRALTPFPWREACPAWWCRDIKPRLPWPSAIFRHIITRRASPIASSNTARSMAFMR